MVMQMNKESATMPAEIKREVALGMTNLGSTCYMNAVLQALAHAPELCMAMDYEPHHITCPIAKENAEKKRSATPRQSPEGNASAAVDKKTTSGGTRKSRRSGKKSPTASSDGEDGLDLQFCALCEVEQHLARVHDPAANTVSAASSKPESEAIAPHAFVHGFVSQVAPWFKLGVQEDSHEFLRLLIDAMQKSCAGARTRARNGSQNLIEDEEKVNKEEGFDEKKETGADQKASEVENEYPFKLFRGTVKSIVTCDSCKTSSSKIDPIEDIGLEVTALPSDPKTSRSSTPPPSVSSSALADVSQAFQRFAKAESLDSGYKCDKCGKVGRATKQSRLASIPPILTLHLKRFRYGSSDKGSSNGGSQLPPRRTGRSELSQLLGNNSAEYYGGSGSAKIEGHIKFDEILDIRPYLTEELQQKSKPILCRLFAVVVHAGKNSHSGHYISYVSNVGKKNDWWKMDDARVTRAPYREVKSAEAYMLFYRVVDHPVAVELRNVAKSREDAAIAVKEQQAATESITRKEQKSGNTSRPTSDGAKKRKREPPQFASSQEWAKAKTRFPPSFTSFYRRVEEFISENVEFKPEFFNLIKEEATKGGKVGGGPSRLSSDDVVGGSEKYRCGLVEMIFKLASQAKNKEGGEQEDVFVNQGSNEDKHSKDDIDVDRVAPSVVEASNETFL